MMNFPHVGEFVQIDKSPNYFNEARQKILDDINNKRNALDNYLLLGVSTDV